MAHSGHLTGLVTVRGNHPWGGPGWHSGVQARSTDSAGSQDTAHRRCTERPVSFGESGPLGSVPSLHSPEGKATFGFQQATEAGAFARQDPWAMELRKQIWACDAGPRTGSPARGMDP